MPDTDAGQALSPPSLHAGVLAAPAGRAAIAGPCRQGASASAGFAVREARPAGAATSMRVPRHAEPSLFSRLK